MMPSSESASPVRTLNLRGHHETRLRDLRVDDNVRTPRGVKEFDRTVKEPFKTLPPNERGAFAKRRSREIVTTVVNFAKI